MIMWNVHACAFINHVRVGADTTVLRKLCVRKVVLCTLAVEGDCCYCLRGFTPFTVSVLKKSHQKLLLLCGERGVGQVVRLLVARDGVRGPRAFEVGQVHSGRGQEGGLEVTVREEETWREVGHERRDQGRRREHTARSVSTHGKCTQRKNWSKLYADED